MVGLDFCLDFCFGFRGFVVGMAGMVMLDKALNLVKRFSILEGMVSGGSCEMKIVIDGEGGDGFSLGDFLFVTLIQVPWKFFFGGVSCSWFSLSLPPNVLSLYLIPYIHLVKVLQDQQQL